MAVYEACSRCGGHGMVQDTGGQARDCPECDGSGYVRARDKRGRFT